MRLREEAGQLVLECATSDQEAHMRMLAAKRIPVEVKPEPIYLPPPPLRHRVKLWIIGRVARALGLFIRCEGKPLGAMPAKSLGFSNPTGVDVSTRRPRLQQ